MKNFSLITVNGFGKRNEKSLLIITTKTEVIQGMKELASVVPNWYKTSVLDEEASKKVLKDQIDKVKTDGATLNEAYKKYLLEKEEKNLQKVKEFLCIKENENKTIREIKEEYTSKGILETLPSPEEYVKNNTCWEVYDDQSNESKKFESLVGMLGGEDIIVRDFADGNGLEKILFSGSISELVSFSFSN